MATRYVNSNAVGANNGTTWADAFTTLAGAAAVDTAGDVIWVAHNHAESTAGAILYSWAGTAASPTRIMCGNTGAQPPTALATTATVTTTTATSAITVVAAGTIYMYGISFIMGLGATSTPDLTALSTPTSCVFESCGFTISTTGTLCVTRLCDDLDGQAIFINPTFGFADVAQNLYVDGIATVKNAVLTGSAITQLVEPQHDAKCIFSGCNFSNGATGLNLFISLWGNAIAIFRNCKLPTSWSGSLMSGDPRIGGIGEMHNCDSGDTNYRMERATQYGFMNSETVIVRSGGATDGTTQLSWKMVSNIDVEWNHQTLDSGEIVRWNETIGSAITATIEIIHDSVTNLTNQDIWLEVEYLGTSGFPLGVFVNDSSGNYLSSAADQTASSATWNTTGLTNPNKQKLSVTFTPQEKGVMHAIVRIAAPDYTVYVDPKIVVT